jgi:hypothetical protein
MPVITPVPDWATAAIREIKPNSPRLESLLLALLFNGHLAYERVIFWIENAVYIQINIKFRPIKVVFGEHFDMENFLYWCFLKPWKMLKRQKHLLGIDQHPDPVTGNVGNLSGENVFAMLCRFHFGAP